MLYLEKGFKSLKINLISTSATACILCAYLILILLFVSSMAICFLAEAFRQYQGLSLGIL